MEHGTPAATIRKARLHYVTDDAPGITRHRWGHGFRYRSPAGRWLSPRSRHRARIDALVIPPAWERVWICADPKGHLQATGYDERGRKQYRYHDRWAEVRTLTRFDALHDFGAALPKIRRRVRRDLKLRGMPRDKATAIVILLLDDTLIRVGNETYARENDSYGLTTFRNRHARVNGSTVRFVFQGKSNRRHDVAIDDRRIATLIRRCQQLPGQTLFEYMGDDGALHPVTSTHVNEYLEETTGAGFTAKDFRTWGGSVVAAETYAAMDPPAPDESDSARRRREVAATRAAAEALRNTMATCRRHYIHPDLHRAHLDGRLAAAFERARTTRSPRHLHLLEG